MGWARRLGSVGGFARGGARPSYRELVHAGLRVTQRVVGAVARPLHRAGLRVVQRVEGVARPVAKAGLRVTQRLTGAMQPIVKAGVRVTQRLTGSTNKPLTKAGLRLTQRLTGALAKPVAKAGHRVTQRVTATVKPQVRSGWNITHEITRLQATRHGQGAVTYVVGGFNDWRSEANAEGAPDDLFARFDAGATGAGGGIEVSYQDFVGKSHLTITKVELRFYFRILGAVGSEATLRTRYNIGGGRVTLETFTSNVDHRVTPKTYDLTGVATTWTHLDTMAASVETQAEVGEGWAADLDAITLYVEAEEFRPV